MKSVSAAAAWLCLLLVCGYISSTSASSGTLKVRRNVLNLSDNEQRLFINSLLALKHEIDPATNISTYDKYVISHSINSMYAHRGPAFLPWHRQFLIEFERDLQRVSGVDTLTIPYWDWSNNLTRMNIWTPSLMGGNGSVVTGVVESGPFANWGVTFEIDGSRNYAGLRRAWGTPLGDMPNMHHDMGNSTDAPVLPPLEELLDALFTPIYDTPPWNDASHNPPSFRNILEGWQPSGCKLHNTIHLWVGGHMRMVAISANDPVFWLHHSFVDKIYDVWQRLNAWDDPFKGYLPVASATTIEGHNLYDTMIPFDSQVRPIDLLDISHLGYYYENDALDEAVWMRAEKQYAQLKVIHQHHTQ